MIDPLVGIKIGSMTVLRQEKEGETHKRRKMLVQCDCGKIKAIYRSNLTRKRGLFTCGCGRARNKPDKDVTGQRFGRLIVLNFSKKTKEKGFYFDCLCDCGNKRTYAGGVLRSGKANSCGCLNRDLATELGKSMVKHGKTGSPIWRIFYQLRYRSKSYGFKLGWDSFEEFYSDMGDPIKGKILSRIDLTKGYSKDNCEWIDRETHMRKRDQAFIIEFNGEKLTIKQWAKKLNCAVGTLLKRLRNEWSIENTLLVPIQSSSGRRKNAT